MTIYFSKPKKRNLTIKTTRKQKTFKPSISSLRKQDMLTGLPHYVTIRKFIDSLIRKPEYKMVVFIIGIDHFTAINATVGYDKGDRLLKHFVARLRKNSPINAYIARKSGDEFVIIIPEIQKNEDIKLVIKALLKALSQAFTLNKRPIFLQSSLGVSVYPQDGTTAEELLLHAYTALRTAKHKGKNCYAFYTSDLGQKLYHTQQIHTHAYEALKNKQFELYYQPQFNLQNNQLVGVEALLRWNHPTLGFMTAHNFIATLEQNPHILAISNWIIATACKQLKKWHLIHPHLKMAINLSKQQLIQNELFNYSLCELLQATLTQCNIDPALIELEITERLLLHHDNGIQDNLRQLKKLGFRIACDDFGIRYASFRRLKEAPLDTIKLDQSLVRHLPQNAVDTAIVSGILSITTQLGIYSIAEGIEHEEQRLMLKKLGCSAVQGYLMSKPLPADEITRLLKSTLKNK